MPSSSSSFSSSADEDKSIVGRIDAIKKRWRLSALGMNPDVERKKAKRRGRERH